MPTDTTSTDPAILIIKQIYSSTVIPESHKDKYVDYILNNGFTEKMLGELDKLFAEEAKGLQGDIDDQKKLLSNVDQMMEEEIKSNDDTQAKILYHFDKAMKDDVQKLQAGLKEVEGDMEAEVEKAGKESESSEIEAIKAKLMKK